MRCLLLGRNRTVHFFSQSQEVGDCQLSTGREVCTGWRFSPPYTKCLEFAWKMCLTCLQSCGHLVSAELATCIYLTSCYAHALFRYWWSGHLKIVIHLDDGLCTENGEREACVWQASWCATLWREWSLQFTLLSQYGCQRTIWFFLWFVLDMSLGHIKLSQSKVIALWSMIMCTKQAPFIKAKRFASILGKIVSLSLALGVVSHFKTCNLNVQL